MLWRFSSWSLSGAFRRKFGAKSVLWGLWGALGFENISCLVYAIDLRGHGDTTTGVAEDEFDLSAERLANDILEVADKLLGIILAGLGEPLM